MEPSFQRAPGTQTQAACAMHPDQPASFTCERCGNFGCAYCRADRPGETWCGACNARFPAGDHGSWIAIAAAITGFVGMGCTLLSPVAFVLGVVELVRIFSGKAPRGGLVVAGLAVGLSVLSVVLWVTAFTIGLDQAEYADPYGDPYADPYGY